MALHELLSSKVNDCLRNCQKRGKQAHSTLKLHDKRQVEYTCLNGPTSQGALPASGH